MKELNAFAPEIVALADAPRPIRFFYSTDSAIQSSSFRRVLMRAYQAAYFLGVPVGFTTERTLAGAGQAEMKSFPMLIVSSATYVSEEALVQLKRYTASGGTLVIIGNDSLTRNEYGEAWPKERLKFLKFVPRLDPAANILTMTRQLDSLFSRCGCQPSVSCRDENGNVPFGVRCVSVAGAANELVYMVNLAREPKMVSLTFRARAVTQGHDLLSNEVTSLNPLQLQPLAMRLISIPTVPRADIGHADD